MFETSNRKSRKEGSEVSQSDQYEVEDGFDIAFGANVYVVAPLAMGENVDMDGSVQQVVRVPELVGKLLTYLPTSDIKSCNGVSRGWRQEARKLLLKRTRMDFGDGRQNVVEFKTQIESYFEEMGDNCHQVLSIHSLGNTGAEMNSIFKLGTKYGYKIRSLNMIMGNPDILRAFPHLTTLWVGFGRGFTGYDKIPKGLIVQSVKTLSLNILTPRPSYLSPTVRRFAKSLLKMCPTMEYLHLNDDVQLPVLYLFTQPYRLTIPKNLTGLALIGVDFALHGPSRKVLNGLTALQLTTLEIDFRNGMKEEVVVLSQRFLRSLKEVLAAFAMTLKHLKLYRIPYDNYGRILNLPTMANVESLEITHSCTPLLKFAFGDEAASGIIYTNQFPVLKQLSIKHVNEFVVDGSYLAGSMALCEMFFPEGTTPCHTLTRVDVDCISDLRHDDNCKQGQHCFCNKEGPLWNMLKRMITMLPNVAKFKK